MKRYLIILAFMPLFCFGQKTVVGHLDGVIWSFQGSAVTFDYYNPIAVSIFNRWTPEPNDSSKFAINRLIDTIEYYGVWDKADIYRIYAANSEASANINTKNTSFTTTPINSPTFTINEGYQGNGSSMYLKENYNPSVDADSFQLDNATIHIYNNTNDLTINDMFVGIYDGTDWIELFNSTDKFRFRLNSTASFTNFHKYNLLGGITLTRRASDSVLILRDNGIYVGSTIASTAIPNESEGLFSLAWNNQGSPSTQNNNLASFIYIGAALTELQAQKLYESEQLYLDYFGKTPTVTTNEITIDPDGGGDYISVGAALTGITDNNYWNRYNLNISDTLYEFGLDFSDKDYINLIGDDTSTAKIIGYLPADTAQAAVQATSVIDIDYINITIRNIHFSIQNGRYAIHSDGGYGAGVQDSKGVEQNIIGCKIVHEGNAETDAYWGTTVWSTPDALGMGLSTNMTINIDSCYTESKGTAVSNSRGIAQHTAIGTAYKSTFNLSNTICVTNTAYSLNISFINNNRDEFYFDNVQLYGDLLIDGSGTYTDNTTQTGTDPIILNGSLIAD